MAKGKLFAWSSVDGLRFTVDGWGGGSANRQPTIDNRQPDPLHSMNHHRVVTISIITVAALLFTATGCAKFPAGGAVSGQQLVLTLTVRGTISPTDPTDPTIQRHYFIAIDNENNPNIGPWAAIYPPYGGNGWVTSSDAQNSIGLTSYVQYDSNNPICQCYNILPGSYFLNTTAPQLPISSQIINGGSTLQVTVDFSQIATAAIPVAQIKQLNVNFILTNSLPVGNQIVTGRIWDALGPSGQNYVNVDTTNNRTYTGDNSDGPTVSDPDLDIVPWPIEVQTVASR